MRFGDSSRPRPASYPRRSRHQEATADGQSPTTTNTTAAAAANRTPATPTMSTILTTPKSWTFVRSSGVCPTARSGHSAVVAKEHLYIFGGCGRPPSIPPNPTDSDDAMPVCLGDLHVYDLARQSWSEISNPILRVGRDSKSGGHKGQGGLPSAPAERTCAAMCASQDEERLFLSGGAGDDPDDLRADLFEFDVRRCTWCLLYSGQKGAGNGDGGCEISSSAACRRIGHAMVHDAARNRLLVFGGSTGFDYFDDTHAFDLSTRLWTRLTTTGDRPSPRYKHQAFIDGNWMYVVGGGSFEPEGPHLDVFRLHLSTASASCRGPATRAPAALKWERLHPTGTPPRCRAAHGLAWDAVGRTAYIWGGFTSRMELDTTFCALRLSPVPAAAVSPPPMTETPRRTAPGVEAPVVAVSVPSPIPAAAVAASGEGNGATSSLAASLDGRVFRLARDTPLATSLPGFTTAGATGRDITNSGSADNRFKKHTMQQVVGAAGVVTAIAAATSEYSEPSGGVSGGGVDEEVDTAVAAFPTNIREAAVESSTVDGEENWQRQPQHQRSLRNLHGGGGGGGVHYHGRERFRRRGQHLRRPVSGGDHGHAGQRQRQPSPPSQHRHQHQQRQYHSRRRPSRGRGGRRRTWGQGWASGRLQEHWGGAAANFTAVLTADSQGSSTASPSPSRSPSPPPTLPPTLPPPREASVSRTAADRRGSGSADTDASRPRLPDTVPTAATGGVGAAAVIPPAGGGVEGGGPVADKEQLAWVSLPSRSDLGHVAACPSPAGRSFHCTFFHAGACYVTGGSDGARKFGDMWRFVARETPPPLTTLAARAFVRLVDERRAAVGAARPNSGDTGGEADIDANDTRTDVMASCRMVGPHERAGAGGSQGNGASGQVDACRGGCGGVHDGGENFQLELLPAELRNALETINMQAKVVV